MPQNKIDNSIDGNFTDTQASSSIRGSKSRMLDTITPEERSFEARMARGPGITDKKNYSDKDKATRSKDPDIDASSRLAKSTMVPESKHEKAMRKLLQDQDKNNN